jgi:hypothetical protein
LSCSGKSDWIGFLLYYYYDYYLHALFQSIITFSGDFKWDPEVDFKFPDSAIKNGEQSQAECWTEEPGDRPSFDEIMDCLKVNSSKLSAFVKEIAERESNDPAVPQEPIQCVFV